MFLQCVTCPPISCQLQQSQALDPPWTREPPLACSAACHLPFVTSEHQSTVLRVVCEQLNCDWQVNNTKRATATELAGRSYPPHLPSLCMPGHRLLLLSLLLCP